MRISIFGGNGMLGHRPRKYLSVRFPDTFTVIHRSREIYKEFRLFEDREHVVDNVDAMDFSSIERVLNKLHPDFVLNCIGITKRREEANDLQTIISLKSLFLHKLAKWGQDNKAKIITFSTDCVFDGKTGNYSEESPTTALDIYGKTKALGEIKTGDALRLHRKMISIVTAA